MLRSKCFSEARTALNVGVYEGEEIRLVGMHTQRLAELTPDALRTEVDEVRAKQAAAIFAQEFWSALTDPPDPPKRW